MQFFFRKKSNRLKHANTRKKSSLPVWGEGVSSLFQTFFLVIQHYFQIFSLTCQKNQRKLIIIPIKLVMPVHILAHTQMDWNTSSSKGCQNSKTFWFLLSSSSERCSNPCPQRLIQNELFLLIIKSFPFFRYELIDKASAFSGLVIVPGMALLFLEHRIYAPTDRKVKLLLK